MGKHGALENPAKWGKAVAFAALGAMVIGSFVMPAQSAEQSEPELKGLKGVEELKALFNADKGSPRLILLFSPT